MNAVAISKIKNNKNLFFSGVAVLTFTNVLNKVIGVLFRIPISNMLGDSGMAYFNAAYHIYTWFYMLSTGGLPLAVSMLVSEARFKGNREEIKRIYKISMRLFFAVGAVGTTLMIVFSKGFAHMNGVSDSYVSIIAVAPTLFLVCIASAMRGYFQGFQEMRPTAVSQIMETAGKLVMGIIFARYALSQGYGLHIVAAYAISGLTIGTAFGMLFLFISKLRFHEENYRVEGVLETAEVHKVRSVKSIVKQLLLIAIPITISSSIMSLTTMVDDMIINWRLMSIGYTEAAANALYGNYTGFAVPFANLPPALIYPISYSLIPLLKGTLTIGDRDRSVEICKRSLKITALISIPCTVGICVMSEPLLRLIYNADSSKLAAKPLSILSLSIFFVCMLSISNAVLQAHGKQNLPIISLVAGSVVKMISSFILIGIPEIGIYGAPISTVICYVVITVFNVYFMSKYTGVTPAVFRTFFKPLVASVISMAGAFGTLCLLETRMQGKLVTVLAVAAAAVIYLIALIVLRGIDDDDIKMFPKGDRILGSLQKIGLFKSKG